MRFHRQVVEVALIVSSLGLWSVTVLSVEPPPSTSSSSSSQKSVTSEKHWLTPILVPADPELETQIMEIQEALSTIDKQIVRRKEAVENASDPAQNATFYHELELLRKERNSLEALLHNLVDEAKASERTAIDEALARARSLERQREYQEQKEELIRERR